MPVKNLNAGCKLVKMKLGSLLSLTIVLFLLDQSSVSIAQQDPASERHIDNVDVHFQEYHLEDDFRPSKILGPIDDFKKLGPKISVGDEFNLPQPKKPHWLGGGNRWRSRYVTIESC